MRDTTEYYFKYTRRYRTLDTIRDEESDGEEEEEEDEEEEDEEEPACRGQERVFSATGTYSRRYFTRL